MLPLTNMHTTKFCFFHGKLASKMAFYFSFWNYCLIFFSTRQIYWKFTNHRIAGEGRDQYHFNNKVSTAANQKEIKFSFEKGKHGKSSFLDVEVSWEGNKFVTTAYHKFKYYYLWIWHDIYFGFQVFFNLF